MNKYIIANELLPIYQTTDTGEWVVDARELYRFLNIGRDFSTWLKERIEKYGFVEGADFSPVSGKTSEGGGRPRTDYILKLDMAKELAMVENNEQGSKARKYFIEVERRFKQQHRPQTQLEILQASIMQLVEQERRVSALETRVTETTETMEAMQETFLQHDEDWRKSINSMLNGAAFRLNLEHRDIRNRSYELLDERAHSDLKTRLRNMVKRLENAGATKTQIKNTNKMDVIENDPHLKEIYTTIVKEISIGSLRIAR